MKQEVEPHILKRYELIRKIGSGAYGHVWKVTDRQTKETLALKKIFDAFQHSTDAQRTYREIMYLQEFSHPNIVKLHNVIRAQNDKDIYLVFEYMEIDLHSVVRENILKDKHKKYIVYQITKALKYLHSAELIHRDLKPSNVLINSECLVKVCDFGLVRSLQPDNEQEPVMTEYVATRWYRAPEILLGSQCYSKAIDVWSLGCLIAEMFRGKPLFPGNSTLNQIQRVLTWTGMPTGPDLHALQTDIGQSMLQSLRHVKPKPIRQWLPGLDDDARDLLSKMLHINPKKRITVEQILRHPYLQQFHDPPNEPLCLKKINLNVSENHKLTVKEYRMLIYKEISRRNNEKKGGAKDLQKSEITVNNFVREQHHRVKRRSMRSITKQEQDESMDRPYGAKTLYIQNNHRHTSFCTPGKETPLLKKGSAPKHHTQQSVPKYPDVRTKYLSEAKDQRSYDNMAQTRTNKVFSSYGKKMRPSSKDFSYEKRGSFEQQPLKKKGGVSIYQVSRNTQLLKRYLTKAVKPL